MRSHLQDVAESCLLCVFRDDLERVKSIEAARRMKTKAHYPAWFVRLDFVPDRTVTTGGSHLQWSIQTDTWPSS